MPTRSAAKTIIRDAAVFKTTPQVWMRLQADWDLHRALRRGKAA